jgi:hypothetical protein
MVDETTLNQQWLTIGIAALVHMLLNNKERWMDYTPNLDLKGAD